MTLEDWYRLDRLPHIFCSGCGHGTILNCTLQAVDELGLSRDKTIFISGIGCSSRSSGYTSTDSMGTTHGRAIAFATGLKLVKPDQTVIVFSGDGDLSAIGANHFVQACRRNIDLTVICMNNNIYGMTGGQCSPCTPYGSFTTTTPYGMHESPFDLCAVAEAAGANYVARWTTCHAMQLKKAIQEGINTPGFSFIDVMSQCPTSYGSKNKLRLATQMFEYLKEHSITKEKMEQNAKDGIPLLPNSIVVGQFVKRANLVFGGGE